MPTNRVNRAFLSGHILGSYHNSRNRKIIDDFVMIREYEKEAAPRDAKKPQQPWRNIIHSHQGFSKISSLASALPASKPF